MPGVAAFLVPGQSWSLLWRKVGWGEGKLESRDPGLGVVLDEIGVFGNRLFEGQVLSHGAIRER